MKAMIRVAGLALLAVLVLGAVGASGASASSFEAEASSVTVEGEHTAGSTHKFVAVAGTTTCKVAKFHSLNGEAKTGRQSFSKEISKSPTIDRSATVTIEPTYEECSNTFLGAVTVKTNGCDFLLTAGEETESGSTAHGQIDLKCPEGKKLEIASSEGGTTCTITIAEQGLGGLLFHNEGSGATRDLKVTANVEEVMTYTQDGVFCSGNGGKAEKIFEAGSYSGNSTLKGTNEAGSQVGLWTGESTGPPQGFETHASSATIHGEQPVGKPHKFIVKAGSTTCEVGNFHSLSEATKTGAQSFPTNVGGGLFTSENLTMEGIYEGCTNTLLGKMTWKMNDCDYRFTAGATVGGKTETVEGEVKIVCHAGGKIEVTRAEGGNPCTITVAEQQKPVLYHNEGTGTTVPEANIKDVKVTTSITTIKYTQDGIFCPGNGGAASKSFEDGTYEGEVTLKGTNTESKQIGVQVT